MKTQKDLYPHYSCLNCPIYEFFYPSICRMVSIVLYYFKNFIIIKSKENERLLRNGKNKPKNLFMNRPLKLQKACFFLLKILDLMYYSWILV